ncbi:glycoside hydrolase family 3 protein [Tumebacillus permanentifrigoris]|uniref:Beta-N-acetylhexosaminidase n=1 Tax=Tumebacillus permanentifrigoris TaxID=378543 RepID=A0A316DBV7_9BACL|nr:glycoside hydrolase family 3 protein [Tumebacillus permanentifrigoris]PWK15627.1 beta-N-acetylhexosaminidase [Tumebacillus permanentifrigoris]
MTPKTDLSALSVRQQIGQTMMFGFHGTEPSPEITRLIAEHHIGGVILFARNVGRPEDVLRLNVALQKIAYEAGHPLPLLISVDQENGIVRRLGAGTTLFPGNMALGAAGRAQWVREVSEATGRELRALGFNFNLAPVLDVNNNPHNPVIGVRAYGQDPQRVGEYGVEAICGLQAAGLAACGKHFPGHGDTSLDSHLTLPLIPHDRARLDAVELPPFMKAITAGVDALMIAHVVFPEFEPDATPATLSHRVITELLREELGYRGVITTDCMEMHAIAKTIGTVEGTYRAFLAGVDLSFLSHTHEWQEQTIERFVRGFEEGEISAQRLQDSVRRILALKERYTSWDDWLPLFDQPDLQPDPVVGCEEHRQLARSVYEAAVTLTAQRPGALPLQIEAEDRVAVVYLRNVSLSPVEDDRYLINPLATAIESQHPNIVRVELSNPPTAQEIAQAVEVAAACRAVVVGTSNAHLSPVQTELLRQLEALPLQRVVISMRAPYDLAVCTNLDAHIAVYEFTPAGIEVAAEALFGKRKLVGHLPIALEVAQ